MVFKCKSVHIECTYSFSGVAVLSCPWYCDHYGFIMYCSDYSLLVVFYDIVNLFLEHMDLFGSTPCLHVNTKIRIEICSVKTIT